MEHETSSGETPSEPAPAVDDTSQPIELLRLCRIERWRGYVSSTFYAEIDDDTVLESRPFRWRHAAPPPHDGAARQAYDELVAQLLASGWRRHAEGPCWYEATFARTAAVPASTRRQAAAAPGPGPAPAAPAATASAPPRVRSRPKRQKSAAARPRPKRPPPRERTRTARAAPLRPARKRTRVTVRRSTPRTRLLRRLRAQIIAALVTLALVGGVAAAGGDSGSTRTYEPSLTTLVRQYTPLHAAPPPGGSGGPAATHPNSG
jgi:hypothetical protein